MGQQMQPWNKQGSPNDSSMKFSAIDLLMQSAMASHRFKRMQGEAATLGTGSHLFVRPFNLLCSLAWSSSGHPWSSGGSRASFWHLIDMLRVTCGHSSLRRLSPILAICNLRGATLFT